MRIGRRALDAILAHARAGYPLEVCGVLTGRVTAEGVVAEHAIAVENRETARPRVRYEIAPEDLLGIQRESRSAGHDVVGFYHSHPDHPERPSETDTRIAAEGLSDGLVYVVVSVDAEGRTTPAAWLFRDATRSFTAEALLVSAEALAETS